MTVPQRLSFSAQLTNCNLATCWHIELSIRGHLSIIIHLSNSFSCSMKFFHLKIALGLALGESWPLLAQPQKNTDVYRQTCINHLRDVNDCKLMGTNTMALIQAIMTVPQRLSFSAQLTNCNVGPCWHVMGHIGACWHSAFSTFHSLGQQLQWLYNMVLSSSFT